MPLTAEEFADRRWEFPDEGRWTELIAGELTHLDPPDTKHGNSVLNLSKRLAEFRQQHPELRNAACFDQGVITEREPDSVFVPAISVISNVGPFELSDDFLTDKCPALVVEIISTPDRDRHISQKLHAYLKRGVSRLWIIDVMNESVTTIDDHSHQKRLSRTDSLSHPDSLPGFSMTIQELFAEPEWWGGSRP